MFVAVYPALVKQIVEGTLADGLDDDVATLAILGIVNGDVRSLASLAVQHIVVVFATLDGLSVYLLDDIASFHTRVALSKGSTLDDFLDAQSIAIILLVNEYTQMGCARQIGDGRTIAGTRVRTIQFAQHFTQHVAEVVVVVDVRQEALVGLTIACPVDTMQLGIIELFLDLTPDVVEQILALLVGLIVEGSLETDGLHLVLGKVYLLDGASQEVERLELAVGLHLSATHILQHQFGLVLQQIVAPEVVAILESGLII